MDEVDKLLYKQPNKGIISILVTQYPKDEPSWMDGWMKIGTLLALVWDGVWCIMSSNHSYRHWHHSQSINGMTQHYTCNQARGSHPYWLHNTPRMDHHEWKKTDTLLASALDGVWCTMSSHYPYTLSPLSIHQYVHVWGWYTITQATKQGDHINTGHTILQRCTMGRWMKTGTRLSLALDIVWYTISSNNPYICFHPSQFINGCMDEFGSPLYKQPNKGITYILATQHPKDVPWVDGWKLGHFHPLH